MISEPIRAAQPLSPLNVRSLLDSVHTFVFDCDGVIWKGEKLIDGVPQTLEMLQSKGKRLVFVTNDSVKSRRQCAEKLQSFGLSVTQDQILTTSFAVAMYLKLNNFPQHNKVYAIGEPDYYAASVSDILNLVPEEEEEEETDNNN